MKDKKICELFAGVGGFRLGFEKLNSNWETVWFSQWEPSTKRQDAHKCYVEHFGDCPDVNGKFHTNEDIATIDKSTIPNHTLLTAGFPCQDFSVAKTSNSAKGLEGKKGVLWWQIYETLKVKRPPFCLFENVDRLLKSPSKQKGRDFGIILNSLCELGYCVEWRVINSADYGSAQKRIRTYIFAWHNRTNYAKYISNFNYDDIIKQYGLMAKAFPVESIETSQQFCIDNHFDYTNKNFTFNFQNAGCGIGRKVFTIKAHPLQENTSSNLLNIIEKDVDEKYYIKEEKLSKWQYLKGAKKIPRTSSNGFTYTYSEGAMSFPDSLDKPSRTLLTSEETISRTSHVILDPNTNKLRTITPIEAERLQGFPDNWTNTGMSDRMRYFCMGNALVVPMITRMAQVLDKIIEKE